MYDNLALRKLPLILYASNTNEYFLNFVMCVFILIVLYFSLIIGDEIALDDDTSYLDDVVKAPAAPDKEPGVDSVRNKDGVPVDEFGLPQVPSAAQTSR